MSGYSYKEWKGTFYPDDLKSGDMLGYYATRFPTVEINNTFYRLPKESVLVDWAGQVPDDFRFVLKASRRITHFNRLKDTESELSYLLCVSSVLGEKRGPTFFQLPPNMKKDLPRLEAFLALLPKRWPVAFEFRHESWFDDAVYAALESKGVALCVADTDDGVTPIVPTVDWGYVRLRRSSYDEGRLQQWADRIAEQPWEETYVFLKHDEGVNPVHAARFGELLSTLGSRQRAGKSDTIGG
jgi:uncharacterized protein YecE (DUF72 family)